MNFANIWASNANIVDAPRKRLSMVLALAALTTLAVATSGLVSEARADSKNPRYVYVVSKVDPGDGVKMAPTQDVRRGLTRALDESTDIIGALPDGAPDPDAAPEKFKRFLAKKKLRAFKVNVEVTAYDKTVETNERGNRRVGVHIGIRLFGETMPDRVMAFAGAGSATVKLDVGKKVRPADEKAANAEAIEVAVKDALTASLKKLSEPAKKTRKKRRRKK